MSASTRRTVLLVQGGYYVVTGVAPFVSRRAFEAVTGPKREWWLVETVGALVTVIGGVLVSGARRRRESPELLSLAVGSAAALATVDVVYVVRRRISPRYLIDAAVQAGLLGGLVAGRRRPCSSTGVVVVVTTASAASACVVLWCLAPLRRRRALSQGRAGSGRRGPAATG